MPRFLRSVWEKATANVDGRTGAATDDDQAMIEELERLREADFVRDFQRRMMLDSANAANADGAIDPGQRSKDKAQH